MTNDKKILVAYFSASGETERLARRSRRRRAATCTRSSPPCAYTAADLDWNDKRSRSSIEMNDPPRARPSGRVGDMDAYDIVFVGFPIWWWRRRSSARF